MRLRPFGDRVLIQADDDSLMNLSETSRKAVESGTIVIPDMYEAGLKKSACFGIVLEVGNKCRSLKPGDRVAFARFSYENFECQTPRTRILKEIDDQNIHASKRKHNKKIHQCENSKSFFF